MLPEVHPAWGPARSASRNLRTPGRGACFPLLQGQAGLFWVSSFGDLSSLGLFGHAGGLADAGWEAFAVENPDSRESKARNQAPSGVPRVFTPVCRMNS